MKLHKRFLAGVLATALLLNNMSTLVYAVDDVVAPPTAEEPAPAPELAPEPAPEPEPAPAEEPAPAPEEIPPVVEEPAPVDPAPVEVTVTTPPVEEPAPTVVEPVAAPAPVEQAPAEPEADMSASNAGAEPGIDEPVTDPEAAPSDEPLDEAGAEPETDDAAIDTGALEDAPVVAQLTELSSDAGVSVKAVLPAGTQLSVSAGDAGAAAAAIAAALPEGFVPADVQVYEITLTDEAGNAVQPTGDAVVTLPAPVAQDSTVYYIHDGEAEYVTGLAAGENSFTASHFSTYAIAAQEPVEAEEETEDVPEDEPAEVTVHFVVFPPKDTEGMPNWTLDRTAVEGEPVALPTAAEIGLPADLLLGGWYLDAAMTQSTLDTPALAQEGATFYAIAVDPDVEYGMETIDDTITLEMTLGYDYIPKKTEYTVGDTIYVTLHIKSERLLRPTEHIMVGLSGDNFSASRAKLDKTKSTSGFSWEPYSDNDGTGWETHDHLGSGKSLDLTFSYTFTKDDAGKKIHFTMKSKNGGMAGRNCREEFTVDVRKIHISSINVTGKTAEETYNGAEQSATVYTLTATDENGDAVAVQLKDGSKNLFDAKGTNAGDYPLTLSDNDIKNAITYDTETYDLPDDVTINNSNNGKLTISKRPITVRLKSAADLYVGGSGAVTVQLDGQPRNLVPGHTLALVNDQGTVNTSAAGDKTITMPEDAFKITADGKDVTGNYVITYTGSVTVKLHSYNITASAGANGKAEPASQTVEQGNSASVTFTPDAGYKLGSLTVNGEEKDVSNAAGAPYTFTISSVDQEYEIAATFVKDTTQTKQLSVTVKYYKDDVVTETGTITKNVWVGDDTYEVTADDIDTNKFGDDYKFDAENTGLPQTVKDGDSIDVYYFKDVNHDDKADKDQTVVIKITGKTDETPIYDGQNHTVSGYDKEVLIDGTRFGEDLPAGVTLTLKEGVSDSVTKKDAGTYDMGLKADSFTAAVADDAFADVTVEVTDGKLTINRKDVTVTADDAFKMYGAADPVLTATVEGLVPGDDENCIKYALYRVAGEEVGTYNILASDFESTQGNYNVTFIQGNFEIKKDEAAAFTTSISIEGWTYGDEPNEPKAEITSGNGKNGYGDPAFTYYKDGTALEGRPTDAGTYTVKAVWTGNKNLPELEATAAFTIAQRGIKLTSRDDTKTYDKKPFSNDDVAEDMLVTEGTFAEGEGVAVTWTRPAEIVDAGGYENQNSFTYELNAGTEAGNYEITTEFGTLHITPAPIRLALTREEIYYDGTVHNEGRQIPLGVDGNELTAEDYAISVYRETFEGGETYKDSGIYVTTVTGRHNYTGEAGMTLIIKPRPITVTSPDLEMVYDNKPFTDEQFNDVTITGDHGLLVDNESLVYSFTHKDQKDVITTGNAFTVAAGENTHIENYEIRKVNGGLRITPRPITIKANDVTKTYDGTYSKPEGYGGAAPAEGTRYAQGEEDGFTFTISRSVGNTRVLKPPMTKTTYAVTAHDNGDIKTSNYAITYQDGTWFFERLPLTVTVENTSKVYGDDDPDFTYTITGLLPEDEVYREPRFDYVYTRDPGEDVGSYKIKAENTKENLWGYDITVTEGTLTINKKAVTLTSATASKTYDGAPLTNHEVTADGFVDGEGATYTVTGSRTVPGTSDNTFTYALNKGTKAGNYEIKMVPGKLTVHPRTGSALYPITVTANSGSAGYDGNAHRVDGFTVGNTTFDGHTYSVSGLYATSGDQYNVGSYPVRVTGTAVVKDADGNDVTENFRVTLVNGTLTIDPAAEPADEEPAPAAAAPVVPGPGATPPAGPAAPAGLAGAAGAAAPGAVIDDGATPLAGPDAGADADADADAEGGLVIEDDDTPLAGGPTDGQTDGTTIEDGETPLGLMDDVTEDCCVLHLLLLLAALAVTVYYTHNRKQHQENQFEMRRQLGSV